MQDYRSLLQSLLDTTMDSIAFKDRDGRYIAMSRTLYEAAGLSSAEELIGKTDDAVFTDKALAARTHADDLAVAAEGQAIGPVEERLEIGGRVKWSSWTKQPLYDAHGEPAGSFMVARDVSAHKLFELALQEQALQLSIILETQRQLAEISDPAEAQELISAKAIDLTGADSAGVMLRAGDRLRYGPGCGEQWVANRETSLAGTIAALALEHGTSILVADGSAPDGLQGTLAPGLRSGIAVPLKHGSERIGVLSVLAEDPNRFGDEQRNALELLAVLLSESLSRSAELDALARFEAVYSGAPIGIGVLDLEGRVTQANDRLARATGRAAADLSGARLLDCLHPDDRAAAEANLSRLIAGELDTYHEEVRVLTAAEQVGWFKSAVALVRDVSGRPAFAVAMMMNVTQQKLAEQELRRQEAETRMHQKLEAVGQLAAGIAHEMNTPMQFVGDSVHFLQDAVTDTLKLVAVYREALADADPAVRDRIAIAEDDADLEYIAERVPVVFDRVYSGVERVSSLVKAMKSFAHSSQVEKAPADLNEAIQTTLTVARNEYKYVADVELVLGDLPNVICNVSDLNQVFLNLIVNSAHAIEDAHAGSAGGADFAAGGGEFGAGADAVAAGERDDRGRGAIRITTTVDGDDVVLGFADDGCGIPEDVRGRIFDPFFTTKDVGRGSGQGLAIAHNIVVDRHHGTLTCSSDVGVGTTIVVRLPIGAAQDEVSERRAA